MRLEPLVCDFPVVYVMGWLGNSALEENFLEHHVRRSEIQLVILSAEMTSKGFAVEKPAIDKDDSVCDH